MTRPVYRKGEDTARDRLEEAFWKALAEGRYETTSVLGLCRAAGVNKNTFYYHFENIDDLAESAATALLSTSLLEAVAQAVKGNVVVPDSVSAREFTRKLDQLGLMATEESSPRLKQMLRDAVSHAWTEAFSIDPEVLDVKERASFEFVLGGFLGVLALRTKIGNELFFEDIWGALYQEHAFSIIRALQDASARKKQHHPGR